MASARPGPWPRPDPALGRTPAAGPGGGGLATAPSPVPRACSSAGYLGLGCRLPARDGSLCWAPRPQGVPTPSAGHLGPGHLLPAGTYGSLWYLSSGCLCPAARRRAAEPAGDAEYSVAEPARTAADGDCRPRSHGEGRRPAGNPGRACGWCAGPSESVLWGPSHRIGPARSAPQAACRMPHAACMEPKIMKNRYRVEGALRPGPSDVAARADATCTVEAGGQSWRQSRGRLQQRGS
jgi:hypothetical protein